MRITGAFGVAHQVGPGVEGAAGCRRRCLKRQTWRASMKAWASFGLVKSGKRATPSSTRAHRPAQLVAELMQRRNQVQDRRALEMHDAGAAAIARPRVKAAAASPSSAEMELGRADQRAAHAPGRPAWPTRSSRAIASFA